MVCSGNKLFQNFDAEINKKYCQTTDKLIIESAATSIGMYYYNRIMVNDYTFDLTINTPNIRYKAMEKMFSELLYNIRNSIFTINESFVRLLKDSFEFLKSFGSGQDDDVYSSDCEVYISAFLELTNELLNLKNNDLAIDMIKGFKVNSKYKFYRI